MCTGTELIRALLAHNRPLYSVLTPNVAQLTVPPQIAEQEVTMAPLAQILAAIAGVET
ncbi:MAG: hypothetical protein KDE19_23720 [Caldilineaceae bacterium]|nr:hypothetical protein [Caldilineaceae bacterium]